MTDGEYGHDERVVVHLVDHPVIPNPEAPSLPAPQLDALGRSGVLEEAVYRREDALCVLLSYALREDLRGGPLDADLV